MVERRSMSIRPSWAVQTQHSAPPFSLGPNVGGGGRMDKTKHMHESIFVFSLHQV